MNPIQFDPPWSPEDHLERVYRRGRQLRRRRQVGIASAALVVVVGLAVSLSGATSPLVHPLQVLTGTSHSSENNSSSASTTTSTSAPNADVADTHTSTTAAGTTNGTASHKVSSQTATTAAGSTVVSSGNTNDTPPTSPIGDCKAGDLRYTTTTDKSSYKNGDTVNISLHVRNAGDRPCYIPSACSSGVWATVQNSDGTTVWENSSHYVGCTKPATQPLLNPNDVHDYGVVGSWAQNNCPNPASTDGCAGDRVAIGTYTATAHRSNVAATPATIALR